MAIMFIQTLATLCLFLSDTSLLAAASPLNARQEYTFETIPPSTNLVWYPCLTNFSCAILDVPLDYDNPSAGRAYVPWIKYSALTQPYKGILIVNYGGPGISGTEQFPTGAVEGQQIVGTNYDVASFDPRGVGYSIPSANCKAPASSGAVKLRRLFTDQLHGPYFDTQFFTSTYQRYKTLGHICETAIGGLGNAGPHMSSAVVARDMISFFDAYSNSLYSSGVQDPSLVNYWGFSYGTVIGQTLANMFPNRVGRFILDGVENASNWYSGKVFSSINFSDEALSTFFVYCNLAGPSQCPYYAGSTPNDILARFERTILKLDFNYATLKGWSNATLLELTLEAVKTYSFQSCYAPIESFPILASFLLDVETALQSLTMAKYENLEAKYGLNATTSQLAEYSPAITCTDNGNIFYGRPLVSFLPTLAILETQSYITPEVETLSQLQCVGWSIKGIGRYQGPFGGVTRNPILFISNTRDPITPLYNGQTAAKLYQGSQLLTIDGTGHTSLNTMNYCSFGKIYNYWQTGALPGTDNFCPLEAGPFGIVAPGGELKKRSENIQNQMKDLMHARAV